MKHKKIIAFLVCFLLLFAVSCEKSESGKATLLIGTDFESAAVYTIELDGLDLSHGAVSLLEYLAGKGEITYETQGTMLVSVDGLKNENGSYVWLWTSEDSDKDQSGWAGMPDHKYAGKTLTSCAVGAYDMTVSDGTVIYIGLYTYS